MSEEAFQYAALTVKPLTSGYVHIRGLGPCNWAQPATWPCDTAALEESFFAEAGEPFRAAVRAENARLLAEQS